MPARHAAPPFPYTRNMKRNIPSPSRKTCVKLAIVLVLYLLFLLWVGSWLGLLAVPFIVDAYITKFINWGWWKKSKNPATRTVMSWVDAIVFALVGVYFLNQFFFQNFVIPSSSLEKTLLTGDYLLVSKLSYGPRIPQTPLTMPLTQNTMPLTGGKSYLEWPKWDYRRVKGLGDVELNDIVVFNYPSGDTVALQSQDRDYYGMVYEIGQQLTGLRPTPRMDYEEQQSLYARMYAAGSQAVRQAPEVYGKVTSRPADRRENYVKRCVGLPGQTLLIRNDTIYLDGKANREPAHSQYLYAVTLTTPFPEEWKRELGITYEDLSQMERDDATGFYTYYMPLTREALQSLQGWKDYVVKTERVRPYTPWLYPLNMAKRWTTSDYGPVWIPKKGATLHLTLANLPIYERPIRVYEGNDLEVRDGVIYINGRATDRYTFKMDYYWMMGDNRDNSADSRFWGFVPEDHIVGKPLFVWLSLDPDYSPFDGKVRWNRIFKWVANIQ